MPSAIGAVEIVIGLMLLVLGSIEAMYAFMMINTLMVGSAALYFGSSSILPALVALGFMILRVMLPGARQMANVRMAVNSNAVLLIFASYIFIASYTLPLLFRHKIDLVPYNGLVKHSNSGLAPLNFSIQNITTSCYVMGSFMMAVVSFVAARQPRTARLVPVMAVVVTGIHVFFGIYDLLLGNTAAGALTAFFRNGAYAQLDQSIGGIVRIKGIAPEPSAYASYGGFWFAFNAELWLRNIRPRITGIAAVVMGGVLLISTSSTALAALGFWGLSILARLVVLPSMVSLRKVLIVVGLGLTGVIALCLLIVIHPDIAQELLNVFLGLTVDKGDSVSGEQRLLFASQGPQAFFASYGLGVGAGTFRSSSLASAILGSGGVIGIIAYLCYLVHVLKPLRRSTYVTSNLDLHTAIGASAAWVVVVQACTASASAPSADPGTTAMMFAGLSLGCRSMAAAKRRKATMRPAELGDPALDRRIVPAL